MRWAWVVDQLGLAKRVTISNYAVIVGITSDIHR
jgi:hypothetical protein